MENKTYHEQKTIEYTKKLREFLAELPSYVTTYFRGIEPRTGARTRLAYANDLRVFFQWLQQNNPLYRNMPIKNIPADALSSLQAFDIEEYMEYLKLRDDGEAGERLNSATAIKRKMSALRSLFNYLYKNQIIDTNAPIQVDMPKLHEKAIVRFDNDEVAQFLDVVENGPQNMTKTAEKFHDRNKIRDLAIMTLLLGTGIRVSEMVGLDIRDVDIKNERIKVVRKGGYEAYVYFGSEVRDALSDYLDERENITDIKAGHEDALFLSAQKKTPHSTKR